MGSTCDFNHIVQARSNTMFTIQGPTSSALAETTTALLTVKNSASNQVTFMDASCKADSALSVDAGAELSVSLATGAHKFWVVPNGCTKEEGCYPCGMDCLGCFYIAPNVGANGVMVTGIGYGHNDPVKVHDGVSSARLTSVDASGKDVDVECSVSTCDFNHIVQARSNTVFTIQGPTSLALAETTTALLTVKNSASNQFAFMDASCKAD